MKIVCAFDSFKGCMSANEVCAEAAINFRKIFLEAQVLCLPMSDGGEGLVDCIAEAVNASMVTVKVHDPLMQIIDACYALSSDGKTAYMEMAASSGLTLVPNEKRNPMLTTTYGVGDLILDAVNRGCKKIIMGIGGSATCDGGKGMIDCLESYLPLPVEIIVASDVNNPLYGPNGAAYVFGPQKGATPEQVILLDNRLQSFARETEKRGFALPDLVNHPGSGAAGGLGYSLMAYLNAKLLSGIDFILDTISFDEMIKGSDFIVTGEGKSDEQTLMGKVPVGILHRAQQQGIPVHLLSGAIEDIDSLLNAGFKSVRSINENDPRPLKVLMQKDVAIQNLKQSLSIFNY